MSQEGPIEALRDAISMHVGREGRYALGPFVEALAGEVEELCRSKAALTKMLCRAEDHLGREHKAGADLARRVEELKGALRFYASEENWMECEDDQHPHGYWQWIGEDESGRELDGPEVARAALSGGERGEE